LRIARRRIIDHLRRLYRQPTRVEQPPERLDETDPEAVSDPAAEGIARTWEDEWERSVLASAIEQVKQTVNPKHFQIFEYAVLREWPVSKVGQTLGVNAAQVY